MTDKIKCVRCEDIIQADEFRYCKCGAVFVEGNGDYSHIGGSAKDALLWRNGVWISLQDARTNWN